MTTTRLRNRIEAPEARPVRWRVTITCGCSSSRAAAAKATILPASCNHRGTISRAITGSFISFHGTVRRGRVGRNRSWTLRRSTDGRREPFSVDVDPVTFRIFHRLHDRSGVEVFAFAYVTE